MAAFPPGIQRADMGLVKNESGGTKAYRRSHIRPVKEPPSLNEGNIRDEVWQHFH